MIKLEDKWVSVKEAEENWDVAKTSVQAKLCAGYNVEHYYRRATSYGKKNALVNVGYMTYVQDLKEEAWHMAHELVYAVKEVYGSVLAFSKEMADGNEAKAHSIQVYLNTNIWNSSRPRSLSDLRISSRLIDFVLYATNKLKEKYESNPDTISNDYSIQWLDNISAIGQSLKLEYHRNRKTTSL